MNQRDAFLARWFATVPVHWEDFAESIDALLAESNKEALAEAKKWRETAIKLAEAQGIVLQYMGSRRNRIERSGDEVPS